MANNNSLVFLNQELRKIQNFYFIKDYDSVILKSKTLIKKYPNVIPFYNAIGLAYNEKREYTLARKYLVKALKISPKDPNVLNNLGLSCKAENDTKNAEIYFHRAIKASTKNFVAHLNLGNLKRDLKDPTSAIMLYEKALEIKDDTPEVYLALADIYKSIGEYKLSKKYCEILNIKFPNLTEQDQILSKIINYSEENTHQKLMLKKLEDKKNNLNNNINLNFSIAKSYEDQRKYNESIIYIDKGNLLRRESYSKYNIGEDEIIFSKMISRFKDYQQLLSKKNFVSKKKFIFIVGLPRSGTTLLHQILSNNKNVYGAGELVFFNDPLTKLLLQPEINNDTMIEFETIKNNFIRKIEELNINQNIIIDKTPGNFMWLGFLKHLFPNCKIIHCKRDLNDTAFSIYKNLFMLNSYKWSYNKDELVSFIQHYLKIIDFWSATFKNDIFHNNYLDLINNPNEQTKKIFSFCELDWSSSNINIQDSKVPIDTLSATQARRPIYKSSINFYKNYENLTDLFTKINSIR